jgi:hypothetical protein
VRAVRTWFSSRVQGTLSIGRHTVSRLTELREKYPLELFLDPKPYTRHHVEDTRRKFVFGYRDNLDVDSGMFVTRMFFFEPRQEYEQNFATYVEAYASGRLTE